MKGITWQFVTIIAIIVVGVTTLELYALSQGVNGTGLAVAISALIGIPAVMITRKVTKAKDK